MIIGGLVVGTSMVIAIHEVVVFDLISSVIRFLLPAIAGMLVYEIISQVYIRRCLRKMKPVSEVFMIINVIVENSFPTFIVAAFVLNVDSMLIYFSPFLFVYFLFIVLSILHLDFRLSVFSGLVAAIQFFMSIRMIIHYITFTEPIQPLVASYTLTFGRTMMIMLTGLASGFVAREIKRRILETYSTMGDRNRIRQILGQQVSPEIVDQILNAGKEIETRRLNVCVMFLDVRDFTPYASSHTPEEVLDYQNKLFGSLIDIVNKHNGIINQILGDGFMATFGAPISRGNDCGNAVNAAMEILEWTQKVSNEGFIHPTRLGIGIHYGEAITGNIGTELRKQFSIVGNVVIRASRIEQLNKEFKSQLLISKEVLERVSGNGEVEGKSLGDIVLKGESEPLEIFLIK